MYISCIYTVYTIYHIDTSCSLISTQQAGEFPGNASRAFTLDQIANFTVDVSSHLTVDFYGNLSVQYGSEFALLFNSKKGLFIDLSTPTLFKQRVRIYDIISHHM